MLKIQTASKAEAVHFWICLLTREIIVHREHRSELG